MTLQIQGKIHIILSAKTTPGHTWSFEGFQIKQRKLFLLHVDDKDYKQYILNMGHLIMFLAIQRPLVKLMISGWKKANLQNVLKT